MMKKKLICKYSLLDNAPKLGALSKREIKFRQIVLIISNYTQALPNLVILFKVTSDDSKTCNSLLVVLCLDEYLGK